MSDSQDSHNACMPSAGNSLRRTPIDVYHHPSLDHFDYRVGDYEAFRQSMLQQLSKIEIKTAEGDTLRPLDNWTSRDEDDYGITLLEMWAYLADILTFYQERIANESYLRTATFDDSLNRFASMIGYQPARGVAATTNLTFKVQEGKKAVIPAGTLIQSVPGHEEKPQKFETDNEIIADSVNDQLSAFGLPISIIKKIDDSKKDTDSIYLKVEEGAIIVGDNLLFVPVNEDGSKTGEVHEREVIKVTYIMGLTRVTLSRPVSYDVLVTPTLLPTPTVTPAVIPTPDTIDEYQIYIWKRKFRLYGYEVPDIFFALDVIDQKFHPRTYNGTLKEKKILPLDAPYDGLSKESRLLLVTENGSHLLGEITQVDQQMVTIDGVEPKAGELEGEIEAEIEGKIEGDIKGVDLNKKIEGKLKGTLDGTLKGVQKGGVIPPFQGTVTRITTSDDLSPNINTRSTIVYEIIKEGLLLWPYEFPEEIDFEDKLCVARPVSKSVDLEKTSNLFKLNEPIIVIDSKSKAVANSIVNQSSAQEIIPDCLKNLQCQVITLSQPLEKLTVDKTTRKVSIFGNVAQVTHGESVIDEVIGDGDSSESFQELSLRKFPVTYIPKPGAPNGAENSLRVRVNNIEWYERRDFYGEPANARIFTTRVDEKGVMYVRFGDGRTGARLPTGRGNVVANYRHGIGKKGNVVANTIKTLLKRPLGVIDVINPQSASGGANPETFEEVRRNAPNTVRTLDRVISIRDFENVAREYLGIAKARAFSGFKGIRPEVTLVVAGTDGSKVEGGLKERLTRDLNNRRDRNRLLVIKSYGKVLFKFDVELCVDRDRVKEDVQKEVHFALSRFTSFNNMELGQSIYASNLVTVAQSVEGVTAAVVRKLKRKDNDNGNRNEIKIEDHELGYVETPQTDIKIETVEAMS